MRLAATVIAAGYGQFSPGKPKLIETVNGQPMIYHIVERLEQAGGFERIYVVVNEDFGERLIRVLEPFQNLDYVVQPERKGTGNATALVVNSLPCSVGNLLITFGDMPMWRAETFRKLVERHLAPDLPDFSLVTIPLVPGTRPERYGRVLRKDGKIIGVIEPWQIKPGQIIEADEVNPSLYCAKVSWLKTALPRLQPVDKEDGFPKEYLLQGVINIAAKEQSLLGEVRIEELDQALGINDRQELEEVRQKFERMFIAA